MSDIATDGAITSAEGRVIAVQIGGLQREMTEVKSAMVGIRVALDALVRMEERQADFRTALGRAFDEIKAERELRSMLEKGMRDWREGFEKSRDDYRMELNRRISEIEHQLPGLRELRKWVLAGVMAGIGLILAGVVTMVVVDPMRRGYEKTTTIQQKMVP